MFLGWRFNCSGAVITANTVEELANRLYGPKFDTLTAAGLL